jgi:hypothetical protein
MIQTNLNAKRRKSRRENQSLAWAEYINESTFLGRQDQSDLEQTNLCQDEDENDYIISNASA